MALSSPRGRGESAWEILDGALEAFVALDGEGRIVEWDPAAEAMFGWSDAEALGRSWAELTVPTRLHSDYERKFARLATAGEQLTPTRIEVRVVRRDGSEFPAELSVSMIDLDGEPLFNVFVHDVGDRHRARHLAASVQSSQDAIVSGDRFGVVTGWNVAAERLFGYTAQEMIGKSIGVLIPPDLAAEEREILRRVMVGEPLCLRETERVRKDGARIAISMSFSPIRDAEGEIVGVAGIARDLTEAKRGREALDEAQASAPRLPHGGASRPHDSPTSQWRDALERVCAHPELLQPVFQPIIDLHRGVVAGYEMLARFNCPPASSPAAWFAAAAADGFTPRLEALVLKAAVSALKRLPPNCFLSINLTPRALLSEQAQLAFTARDDWRGVIVELTEQIAVGDYDPLKKALRAFRHAGGMLAIDDVGAGYSNLRHITVLRPEFVKLDRALVRDIDHDEANRAAVATLGALADRLDMWVVAEGVERASELDALVALGVPLAQGFAIARPSSTMGQIDNELSARLRSLEATARDRETLAGVIEAAVAAADREGADAVGFVLSENPHLEYVPILDESARPVAIANRGRPEIENRRPLCVQIDTPPADAALRAIARPLQERFDPLACCDEQGRYLGIVKVERLIETLADPIPKTRRAQR